MKCRELIKNLEKIWPSSYALDFDNVGLQVGDLDSQVNHILIAMDLTDEVLDEAIEKNVDFIITHHPLLFSGMKQVSSDHFIGRRIMKLIRHNISCFAMHTNYDVLSMGSLNARTIGLSHTKILQVTKIEQQKDYGIGKIGRAHQNMSLKEYASYIKERLQVPQVLVYGDTSKMINKVAISSGSGRSMIPDAIKNTVDVLITGDVDYHSAIDAVAQGLTIIDAGHYGTEYQFAQDVKEKLEAVTTLKIEVAKITHPMKVIC